MDLQDVDCAFEKCMAYLTDTFRPSPECLLSSSRYVNASSTASNVEYFASIFLPTTSIIGIICNLINIFVLSRIKYKSCFLRLLCFLAFFDTGILLSGILYTIPIIRLLFSSQHAQAFFSIYQNVYLFDTFNPFNFFILCGRRLTVAISLERFLGICYPLKFPAKYRKSRHLVIPVFFTAVLEKLMWFYSNNNIFLPTILFIIVPILILIVFNMAILFTLTNMKYIAGSSKEKVLESALVLISVVIIYLFCWTPTVIRLFYFSVFKASNDELWTILLTVAYFAVILNSSINFFIYCLVGKSYRRHVKKAFSCSFTGINYSYSQDSSTPLCASGFKQKTGQSTQTAEETDSTQV